MYVRVVFPPACTACQEDESHTCAIVLSSFFLKSLLRSLVVFELVSYCCYNSYHILNDLKQHKFIILQFWRSRVLKLRCQQAHVPSGGLKEKSVSQFFLAFDGFGSWHHPPSSRATAQHLPILRLLLSSYPFLTLIILLPLRRILEVILDLPE